MATPMREKLRKTGIAIGACVAAFGASRSVAFAADCPALLVLERSVNTNRVWYEAESSRTETPIRERWEMRERGHDVWEELTRYERDSLYGLRWGAPREGGREVWLAAVPAIRFVYQPGEGGRCPALGYGSPAWIVERASVTLSRGLIPALRAVALTGHAPDGHAVREVMNF